MKSSTFIGGLVLLGDFLLHPSKGAGFHCKYRKTTVIVTVRRQIFTSVYNYINTDRKENQDKSAYQQFFKIYHCFLPHYLFFVIRDNL